MTETQHFLLELMKEFDGLCRKYDIKYYLAGGCLIGALRNGGFLPWDDDADVHMTAAEGYRLMEAIKKEGLTNRLVYIKSEDGSYMNVHWRYQNTDTTLLMRGQTGAEGPQGQFVDMFVMYPLPRNQEEKQQVLDDFEIYKELKAQNCNVIAKRSDVYLDRFLAFKEREKKEGKKKVLDELEERMFSFPEEGAEEYFLCCPTAPKHAVPISWWGEPRYVKFEDTVMPVPQLAEKFLAYEYGPNWFEVPAHEERQSHVFVKDFEIPYRVYLAEYDKYLDSREFFRQEVEKKDYWYRIQYERNRVNPQILKMKSLRTSLEIQQSVKEHGWDLLRMVEKGEEEALKAIFSSYYALVADSSIRYWGIYVDMPDEYLYGALYFPCFNGNYGIARKVLRQRRELEERPMLPQLERLCRICDMTEELLYTIYGECDDRKGSRLAEEFLKTEPEVLYFMRAKARYQAAGTAAHKELLAQAREELEEFLKAYPNDGELLTYKGNLLLIAGEREQAESCYKKAYYNLSNGYCIRAIKEYFEERYGEVRI